ncbi:MAG: tRNA pseudouridine(55) synthase TruB, partial [Sphingomonadales bacterium]
MARRRKGLSITGWLNFNKPLEMSSNQAVGKARWLLKAKKAGHAGTLDPLATGVLPIAFGEATKVMGFLPAAEKAYRFSVAWGAST